MLTLIHHGAVMVGVPYSVEELAMTRKGGTPYGPTAVVGAAADEAPTETDLKIAAELGKRVSIMAGKLKKN
jgi:NAD(P)H dehydrogenase (quinone)